MGQENNIILVDENDNQIWIYDKLNTHIEWRLHRAFSIFIFNSKNELLLQRRAIEKYHSWWLWTNTVCSHQKPGENIKDSTKNRMVEEMWFFTEVEEIFSFLYKSDYENWLTEHEFDHVFIWFYNFDPIPNPEEVMDYKWINIDDLKNDTIKNPEKYTSWLKIILEKNELIEKIKDKLIK